MLDDIATLFELKLGPWLTPLRGKIPQLDAWQTLPPVDEAQVREWVEAGYNLGLRTGSRSGVIVIDDDQAKHDISGFQAPPTGLVVDTPTGGKHYYYRAPTPCPGNTASKLAPHVDTRGEGGQVVVPPSIHPTARATYRFSSVGPMGEFPVERVTPPKPKPPVATGSGYAAKALASEVHRVRTAPEGTRNDSLNRAAFSAGQLVAGGVLDSHTVQSELLSAAMLVGLSEREAISTIASGLKAGAREPRGIPERPAPTTTTKHTRADVLTPGAHVMPSGEYVEQGTDTFAAAVLSSLAPDTIYRRAAALGEITDGSFNPTPAHRMRSVVDASVRLIASKPVPDGEAQISFRTCSRDLAQLVLEYGQIHGEVRELKHLATHPVVLGPDFIPAKPGWNQSHGVYLSCESVPAPLDLATSRAVLDDLIADFPFQAEADRQNFLGLLLTPILRPAINEPVPMHLIGSPMERTGKTKLAEVVLGVSITGRRTPAMQLGEREEEREKRILSVLVRGQGLLHLDNLSEFIDSPSLASLLTSSEYQGRMLGSSHAPTLPNGLTVVGTGNNVHATGEIAKRIVPVRLMPSTGSPETRTDFRHPDLLGYVSSARQRVLAALLGLVEHWRVSGRPTHGAGFGGFERWTAVVGGVLQAAGYAEWLTNLKDWRGDVNDSGNEDGEFVLLWSRIHGTDWVEAAKLYELARDNDLYGRLDRHPTDRAKRTAFGRTVLSRLDRVIIDKYRIEVSGVGSRRQARLSTSSTSKT